MNSSGGNQIQMVSKSGMTKSPACFVTAVRSVVWVKRVGWWCKPSGLAVSQHICSRCSSRAARDPEDGGSELVGLLIREWKFWKWWQWWK